MFRTGRLGNVLNFNWKPDLLKEYGEKKFGISWPKDKEWDFFDSVEYKNIAKMAAKFGYNKAKDKFAPNAKKIIASYDKLKKDEKKKEFLEKRLVKHPTGKIIKDKDGNDQEEYVCNWLLHYLYTFHDFNDDQDIDSFTNIEQIKRFDYGNNRLTQERLGGIRNGIKEELKNVVQALDETRKEINAQEVKGLMADANDVKNQLLFVESAVKVAMDQVQSLGNLSNFRNTLQDLENKFSNLQGQLNNLSLGSSSISTPPASAIEQVTKEAIKKIKQKLNEL